MNAAAPSGVALTNHGTFAALVQDDTDLVGHVAYSLYKSDKLKFCENETARTGVPVTQDVIDGFIRGSILDTRIAAYRAQAEKLLEQMTEYVLEDAIQEVNKEHQETLVRKLSEGKSWSRAIAENFFGSVVVALVWALIVVMIAANKVGPDKVIGDFLGKEINDRQQPARAPAPAPSASKTE